MIQKSLCISLVCWGLLLCGVSPEIYGLNIASSTDLTGQNDAGTEHISSALALSNVTVSSEEIRVLLSEHEIRNNAGICVQGGGYYSSQSSNQYSSFFGNAEAFLTELVEFFLFIALLSYVVGYEEWLPWEKSE